MWFEEWMRKYQQAHQNYMIKHLDAEINALSEHIQHCVNKRMALRMEKMRHEIELSKPENRNET